MMTRKKSHQLPRAACWATAFLLFPAVALAQQYEKVTDALGEKVPAGPFILASYGFIWVAVLVYVIFVARGLGRVKADLETFHRKMETESKKTVER